MYFVNLFSSLEGQNYACSKINPKYILDKVMEDKIVHWNSKINTYFKILADVNILYTYIKTAYKQKHKFHSIYPENPWTCLSSYFLTDKNQKFKKGSSMQKKLPLKIFTLGIT